MLKLKQAIHQILQSAPAVKAPEAETDLILFHFFREAMKTAQPPVATPEQEAEALQIARKRATGIPLQHLLGYQFFYEHEYAVTPAVLIPRPETETLVQAAIGWLNIHGGRRFAELGLGSGAISGELLAARPDLNGVASEVSLEAQQIARQNLKQVVGIEWEKRLEILTPASALIGFEVFLPYGSFDLVVSNPPYVSREDEIEGQVIHHEPGLALFPDAGVTGRSPNYFYEDFVRHAKQLLKRPNGAAFLEVPHERADILAQLSLTWGMKAELIPDLTGRSRVLKVTF